MDARHATVEHGDLFSVVGRVLRAVRVAFQPASVHAQRDIGRVLERSPHHIAREQDVRIAADKTVAHEVLRVHQREHDVVVLPVAIVAEGEMRIIALHLFNLVAADKADVRDSCARKRAQTPVKHPTSVYFRVTFRGVCGCRHQAASAAGCNDNGLH